MGMQTEIEAKFPDVDPAKLRNTLLRLGATQEHAEVLMRRKNFDYPDKRLEEIGGWVRVRDEGNKVTCSYKQVNDRTLHGTKEACVTVDDFDTTCALLEAIGLKQKSYQETKREKWLCRGAEVTIDTWPWIPSFVEIEGPSEDVVRAVAHDLGLEWGSAMPGSVETIYQMHYDFSEEEIDSWSEIIFSPPPSWLLARKKNS